MLALFSALLNVANIIPTSANQIKPDIAHLVRMSAIQAALSTIFSLSLGIMLAWALNRLEFFGKKIIVALFASAIVAPSLVIALGIVSIWGRNGFISNLIEIFALNWNISIFGLGGILLAHTILNGAFAATILLARLDNIAINKLKIGQSLNLSPSERFMALDLPSLNGALPALASIIFLLSFTSFPIVLMLGGGPSNQTLEVAIFSAVRLSFDLKTAVQLSIIQLLLCIIIILPAIFSNPKIASAGVAKNYKWRENNFIKLVQFTILFIAIIFFALPLLAILFNGFGKGFFAVISHPSFLQASITSLIIGFLSAILTFYTALKISQARLAFNNILLKSALSLPLYAYLIIPAIVLSLGFYILAIQLGLATSFVAPFVLILGNSLLALPFAIAVLAPQLEAINQRYDRLCSSINLSNYSRWRYVEWPLLGREIGLVLALGFCFSLGDLGIISLFGTNEFTTLPWAMYQAFGAYRNNDAATIGAIMLILSLLIFFLLPLLFRKWSHVRN